MAQFPNPVFRSALFRAVAPIVPVWLFGCVLALELDQSGLVAGPQGLPQVSDFLAVYSALVLVLLLVLAVYQYRSSPAIIDVGPEGVSGTVPRRIPERQLTILYPQIHALAGGDLFGYRLEGRAAGASEGPLDWLNLTEENAERVTAAWVAWRQRNAPSPGSAST